MSAFSSVEMRFSSPSHPCPVCGSWATNTRQHPCKGYMTENFINCENSAHNHGALTRDLDTGTWGHLRFGQCRCGVEHNPKSLAPSSKPPVPPKPNLQLIAAPAPNIQAPDDGHWYYQNEQGETLYVVRRFNLPNGEKDFKIYRLDEFGHLALGLGGAKLSEVGLLYNLPRIAEANSEATIYVVEGEKCADRLQLELDLMGSNAVVTTIAGGASRNNWRPEFNNTLANKIVVLVPDQDPEKDGKRKGQDFMDHIYRQLKDHVASIKTVDLPVEQDGSDVADYLEDHTLAEFLEICRKVRPQENPFKMPIPTRTFRELAHLPRPRYLLKPYFIKGYIGMVYGQTQTSKSFFMMDKAIKLALKGNRVVYIAGENANGYFLRGASWLRFYGIDPTSRNGIEKLKLIDENLLFVTMAVKIMEIGQLDRLAEAIERRWGKVNPDMFVIDTLSRSFSGNENETEDMQAFRQSLEKLRVDYNANVTVVHHKGKGDQTTPRGSSVILGDFDTIIELKAVQLKGEENSEPDDRFIQVSCEKQKDAEMFKTEIWKLIKQPLEEDYLEALGVPPRPDEYIFDEDEEADEDFSASCVLVFHRYEKAAKDGTIEKPEPPSANIMKIITHLVTRPAGARRKEFFRVLGIDYQGAPSQKEKQIRNNELTNELKKAKEFVSNTGQDGNYILTERGWQVAREQEILAIVENHIQVVPAGSAQDDPWDLENAE